MESFATFVTVVACIRCAWYVICFFIGIGMGIAGGSSSSSNLSAGKVIVGLFEVALWTLICIWGLNVI